MTAPPTHGEPPDETSGHPAADSGDPGEPDANDLDRGGDSTSDSPGGAGGGDAPVELRTGDARRGWRERRYPPETEAGGRLGRRRIKESGDAALIRELSPAWQVKASEVVAVVSWAMPVAAAIAALAIWCFVKGIEYARGRNGT
jgi:hypothetical protein